jgi:ABC-type uncharacterized transport system permease subunit
MDNIKNNRNISIFIYTIITLIIIGPLLNEYIFFLDWNISPTLKFSNIFYGTEEIPLNTIPTLIVEKLLGILLPTLIIQKISIFLILFLSGISMHSLINTKSQFPKYFAGLLYMLNPFVYIRFMAGHWLILMAYAILPFAVKSIMKFFNNSNKKQIIKTCFWITLIGILNIHTLVLILFLFFIFLIYKLTKTKEKKQIIKSTAILALFFILLNVYWLLPLATAESNKLQQITSDDLAAFETRRGDFNEFMQTLMMYGFWRENAYILPRNIIPIYIYFPIFALILFLTIHGYLNSKEKYKTPILITGILAQLLAVGVGHPWFRDFFTFLFNQFFFMKGFREPQKFVALLVFAYAFLGAYGIDNILEQIKRKKVKILASVLIIAIPFAYTPTIFGSFWGQLKSADYPQDWYEINSYLNQDKQDFNVLFLPWHLYMDFKWIPNQDKRIANPANSFFDKPTIRGDNVEIGRIYSSSENPTSKYIESLLKEKRTATLGNKLRIINVKYVLLTKEIDYKNYFFLFNQTDLELIKETDNLYLFKNKLKVNKFYQTDSLDKLELSKLDYEKKSPVKYVISEPSKKYIIFVETHDNNWKLGNQEPIKLGPVNAYEYENKNKLKYARFRLYFISYIISAIFLIILVIVYNNLRFKF